MSKFNARGMQPKAAPTAPVGFITTATKPTGRTGEGAPGYARADEKSELFLLAAVYFFGTDTIYEAGIDRNARFKALVRSVAVSDPDWTKRFLIWLRTEAHLRTAPIVGAVEAADAMAKAKIPGGRGLVDMVLRRGDEPAETLAYWISQFKTKTIPKPIQRGIADAAERLYTEYNWLKWDSTRSPIRFADVLELCHPAASAPWQADLYEYVLATRHNRDEAVPGESLAMIRNNIALRASAAAHPEALLDPVYLKAAGLTWEDALSILGTTGRNDLKTRVWESLIDANSVGYMALLRNLRNLSEAGISKVYLEKVIAKLTDADEVARSKQLPFRFLSAQRALKDWPHLWAGPLEKALELSLTNVPVLPGKTLVLVDVSGSMDGYLTVGRPVNDPENPPIRRVDAAAIFGSALALKNPDNVTLVAFESSSRVVQVPRGGSILALSRQFRAGGGTSTRAAVRNHFRDHARVVILTDEQSYDGDPATVIPSTVPLYTWNLAGYKYTGTAGGPLRYTFGGLGDSAFGAIPLLEAGENQSWPF